MYEYQKEERSLGDLIGELTAEARTLVRQEIALARAELRRIVSRYAQDGTKVGAGALLAHTGFLAIVAGAILALALVVPLWASALIVGVVLALAGYLLIRTGINDMKENPPVPEQTIASLKEDKEWVQNQMR
jgi:Flp pilus assembly protein TadB